MDWNGKAIGIGLIHADSERENVCRSLDGLKSRHQLSNQVT